MKKEALIKLQGRAEGEDGDVIDFSSMGTVSFEDSGVLIEYDESEMSGMEGTSSRIFIGEDSVTLSRVGEYISTMAFIEGEELPAEITTPHGLMTINIYTDSIAVNISHKDISLSLNYVFTLGGERVRNLLQLSCKVLN